MNVSRSLLQSGLVAALVLVAVACSSSSSDDGFTNDDDAGSSDDAGTTTTDDSGNGSNADSGSTTDSGTTVVDSGSSTDIPPINSPDGFGAARTACINEINRLRATQGHAALAVWTGAGIDACVDEQATSDEAADVPHQAWGKSPAAICDGNAQDECEGYPTTAAGVVSCLDSMWAEKDKPHCSGCAACSKTYTPDCPNCDYSGTMGYECGHYVNMSADWLNMVDCGFSTSSGGTWSTQNFSQ